MAGFPTANPDLPGAVAVTHPQRRGEPYLDRSPWPGLRRTLPVGTLNGGRRRSPGVVSPIAGGAPGSMIDAASVWLSAHLQGIHHAEHHSGRRRDYVTSAEAGWRLLFVIIRPGTDPVARTAAGR